MNKTYNVYKVFGKDRIVKISTLSTVDCTVAEEIDYKDLNHDLWIVEENGTIQVWKRPQSNKNLSQGIIRCEMVEERKGSVVSTGKKEWFYNVEEPFYTVNFELDTESVESTKVETKSVETTKPQSTLVEYNGNFSSTEEVRNYVLDNREDYEGYIVRSSNCWDSDTIYRWEEKDNSTIIWRKTKA